jgi:hypothetical protein
MDVTPLDTTIPSSFIDKEYVDITHPEPFHTQDLPQKVYTSLSAGEDGKLISVIL